MNIEITFLGTGSAVPTAKKNHVGTLISYSPHNILIDCGEGTQRQFRIAKLNPCKLTHIFITHWHGDHTLGIPGLLETLAMSEYQKTLHIYGPKKTKHKIDLFEKIYGKFKIKYKIHEISSGKILDEKDFTMESSPMSHGIPTNAYSFKVKDKLRLDKKKIKKLKLPNSPLLGKLQQGKDITFKGKKIKAKSITKLQRGKKVTVIMDTIFNTNAIKISKNSDLLISEASYITNHKDKAKKYKHLTVKQAATIANKSKSKKLIITHNSQRYGDDTKPILKEAKKFFKNSTLAKDFDKVIV